MARIARKGFEYYRAETDRFRDIKIRKLRMEYNCAGYAVYQYVLNEIYRVEGCYIRFTADELFDCAEYWNMKDEEVMDIIHYCADLGLFNAAIWKEYGILTARSIQVRYASMCHAAKRKTIIPDYISLLSEENVDCPSSMRTSCSLPMEAATLVPESPQRIAATAPAVAQPQEVRGIQTLKDALEAAKRFAPESILPEESGILPEESRNIPENTIINKSKANNIPSSTPSTAVSDNPEEEENLLKEFLFLGLSESDFRQAIFLKGYYPEIPLATAIQTIKSDPSYKINGGYLKSLISNYFSKYNAEYAPIKKQNERSAELDRMGIPPKEKEMILQCAAVAPSVYDAAMAEIKKSKGKIKSPLCFLKSRLMPAKTA